MPATIVKMILLCALLASLVSAECYSTYVSFEDPQPKSSGTGTTSKGFSFPGFDLVDDGPAEQIPQNTGVVADTSPNFIGYGLQSQASSHGPSIEVGSDFTSFGLRTMMFACMEDEAGRNASLPAVNCGITLTCIKPGGAKGGSQTLQYTYGGVTNAMMQAASLDLDTFKCCKSIQFSTNAPKVSSKYTVATVIDTLSMQWWTGILRMLIISSAAARRRRSDSVGLLATMMVEAFDSSVVIFRSRTKTEGLQDV
ncbi:hypothetical protein NA57DRAFT_59388 [Rhizodiscina lignyota]|uniref:Uncharacterized protein n=1 Tax=Rhizodiscina lignyota TaxID=1504668 RepID=A0A9P4IBS6_9PEZI|nr:hypothetical protein NA57DRAFT_59388 [Rhizodiscina lignyota]